MKKKLGAALLSLCLMLVMLPMTVLAAEVVTTEEELKTAIQNGGEITLGGNIALTSRIVISTGSVTLDLNGHTISLAEGYSGKNNCMIQVNGGASLTLNDSIGAGKITNTTNSNEYGAVAVLGNNDASRPTTLVINGGTYEGYYYGVVGNGQSHNTRITINGGTITNVSDDGTGIYHPQDGEIMITDGTISGGATGIELRSGKLTMTGGTVTSRATNEQVQANGSGITTIGAGIAVSQHVTQKDISVDISGGRVSGYTAFLQVDPQNNQLPDTIELSITGGVFEVANGGTTAVSSVDKSGFVSGGTFTAAVDSNYIASDVAEVSLTSGGSTTYYVGTSEQVTAAVSGAESGDTITVITGSVAMTGVAEGVTVENKTTDGTVSVNGSTVDSNAPLTVPHTHNTTKTEAKPATCTEAGNIAYWYCESCGKYFSDEALTKEITQADIVVAATGHKNVTKVEAKAATSTTAGNIAYWYCSDCGKYFSDEALTKEIAKADTVVAATGQATTNTTTATGTTKSPKTGDNSSMTLWIVLLVLSCGGMAGVLFCDRKKKSR